MSHDKTGGCSFYAFDHVERPNDEYTDRVGTLLQVWKKTNGAGVFKHESKVIHNETELSAYEAECLELGYEGLILRDPNSKYKFGRGTAKEQIILKLKRFRDDDATIVGFEERNENTNEKTVNELGRSKRSSHQAGKVGRGDLGALLCDFDGIKFAVGTGFDDALRAEIWNNQAKYLGQLIKFKHFPIGVKTAPRHPVFISFRDRIDT
jgi:DNA ligase-1